LFSQAEIDDPNGMPARLKKAGVEVAALYYLDETSKESNKETYQVVPAPIKTDNRTGAPVYALTRDCPRILPPMMRDADTIVFGLKAPSDGSEDLFWLTTSVLGHTLQDTADHRLKYAIIDSPNPLTKKQLEAKDLTDKLKPFGSYSRQARQHGLSWSETASRINENQLLELEIELISGR
jgi:uncharacterized protein YbbC (DUF1343 family)